MEPASPEAICHGGWDKGEAGEEGECDAVTVLISFLYLNCERRLIVGVRWIDSDLFCFKVLDFLAL